MEIKAADVAKLRKMTGAGMMDCKKALVEANGDYEKAKEIIREKGKLVAAKRSDRETTEGSVIAKVTADNKKAILVSLGCETDFVANNEEFKALAEDIANTAINNYPADLEALKACKLSSGVTVEEGVTQQTGKSGEKHAIPYYSTLEAGYIASDIHINHKVGAIVGFNKPMADAHVGKEIAMQVTAMNPVSLTKDDCPKEVIEKELEVAVEKTKEEMVKKAVEAAIKKAGFNPAHFDSEDHMESNQSKGWITAEDVVKVKEIIANVTAEKSANMPEQMINNIAQGRLAKFFKESTLEEQTFVQDGKISVREYLKKVDPELKITGFRRFSLAD